MTRRHPPQRSRKRGASSSATARAVRHNGGCQRRKLAEVAELAKVAELAEVADIAHDDPLAWAELATPATRASRL